MVMAYNELYLNDAQIFLADLFDTIINDVSIDIDFFSHMFVNSPISHRFEIGDPSLISGKSGKEAAMNLLEEVMPDISFLCEPHIDFEKSPAYWAGYYLAYYQWYTRKRFKDIFMRIPLKEIVAMYKIYHEMDISNFVSELDRRYDSVLLPTKLKTIREAKGLSQNQLAVLSGVNKRSIQLYEQRVNDIDKAQGQALYKLARVLCCSIEDLLEKPEAI